METRTATLSLGIDGLSVTKASVAKAASINH